ALLGPAAWPEGCSKAPGGDACRGKQDRREADGPCQDGGQLRCPEGCLIPAMKRPGSLNRAFCLGVAVPSGIQAGTRRWLDWQHLPIKLHTPKNAAVLSLRHLHPRGCDGKLIGMK